MRRPAAWSLCLMIGALDRNFSVSRQAPGNVAHTSGGCCAGCAQPAASTTRTSESDRAHAGRTHGRGTLPTKIARQLNGERPLSIVWIPSIPSNA